MSVEYMLQPKNTPTLKLFNCGMGIGYGSRRKCLLATPVPLSIKGLNICIPDFFSKLYIIQQYLDPSARLKESNSFLYAAHFGYTLRRRHRKINPYQEQI